MGWGVAISIFILLLSLVLFACDDDRDLMSIEKLKKISKYSIISFIICLLGVSFIPTTKEAYMIYGLGGAIDYIKENDKAKQLPDKFINYLDKWIDKEIGTEESVNN
jgi:hypothetical protein